MKATRSWESTLTSHRRFCDKLGYELKVEDMEFSSILPAVQSGKADFGAAGMDSYRRPRGKRELHRYLCQRKPGDHRKEITIQRTSYSGRANTSGISIESC